MGWDAANARTPSAQAPTERCASAVRRTAVMYHAHHGTKLVLVWPPTIGNLETLGGSWMDGDAHKPLDAMRPFSGGGVHILNPGERLIIAPLAVHLVVNLTPALSVGTNFNCPTALSLLKHLNGLPKSPSVWRDAAWYKKLLSEMVSIGLELKTAGHLGTRLAALEKQLR